jgi:hypothetical protein
MLGHRETDGLAAAGAGPGSVTAARKVTAADEIGFELTTAALYHRARLAWFAGLHRVGLFLNVLFGTAAVAALVQSGGRGLAIAARVMLAVVSAAGLAFDFAGLARRHEDRRRVYHTLAAELETCAKDEAACRELRARMILAAADDPAVYRAAEAVAYNAAIKSTGRDKRDAFVLTCMQRLLRHLRSYGGADFPKVRDLPQVLGREKPSRD